MKPARLFYAEGNLFRIPLAAPARRPHEVVPTEQPIQSLAPAAPGTKSPEPPTPSPLPRPGPSSRAVGVKRSSRDTGVPFPPLAAATARRVAVAGVDRAENTKMMMMTTTRVHKRAGGASILVAQQRSHEAPLRARWVGAAGDLRCLSGGGALHRACCAGP
eukprot:scaffold4372_cov397-Prasinococcus_capsulatus_cf.AAC.20